MSRGKEMEKLMGILGQRSHLEPDSGEMVKATWASGQALQCHAKMLGWGVGVRRYQEHAGQRSNEAEGTPWSGEA